MENKVLILFFCFMSSDCLPARDGKSELSPGYVMFTTFFTRRFASYDGQSDFTGIVHLNFQLNPVSTEYGEVVGIFAEAGFGAKGIICTGIFVWF